MDAKTVIVVLKKTHERIGKRADFIDSQAKLLNPGGPRLKIVSAANLIREDLDSAKTYLELLQRSLQAGGEKE